MSPPRLWSSCHGNLTLPKLLGWEGDQIHWEETAVASGPWPRTGAVGKTGPTHPDDTPRGTLQMGRTGILWLLDHCDEKQGRSILADL